MFSAISVTSWLSFFLGKANQKYSDKVNHIRLPWAHMARESSNLQILMVADYTDCIGRCNIGPYKYRYLQSNAMSD